MCKIKFGKLVGKTPKEAIELGLYLELINTRNSLKNFIFDERKVYYKKDNFEMYLACEEAIIEKFTELSKEFYKIWPKVPMDKKKLLQKELDFNAFYDNDIIKVLEINNKIKSILAQ